MRSIVAPLFEVRALQWEAPEPGAVDAMLLTSANAARHGGDQLRPFQHLPCFAVGEATAAAAGEAGFEDIRFSDSDGAAALQAATASGARRLLHLTGRDHIPLASTGIQIIRRLVYMADEVPSLPQTALDALWADAITLIHSPRAGARFASLLDEAELSKQHISIAAISPAAAAAAGPGWRSIETASRPRDDALLELAAKLCKIGASVTGNGE